MKLGLMSAETGPMTTSGWSSLAASSAEQKICGVTTNTCCFKSGGACAIVRWPADIYVEFSMIHRKAVHTASSCCGKNTYVPYMCSPCSLPKSE